MSQRILKAGIGCGVVTAALGFANLYEIANPPPAVTLLAQFGVELFVAGIIISVISGAGLLVFKRFS